MIQWLKRFSRRYRRKEQQDQDAVKEQLKEFARIEHRDTLIRKYGSQRRAIRAQGAMKRQAERRERRARKRSGD